MTSEPMRLGALEAQVMDTLWRDGPGSIRQVIVSLGHNHAYTTIATVLGNLERKGLVQALRGPGRSVTYDPISTREQHAAKLMGQALDSSGNRAGSIRYFVQSMSPDDVDLLREFLSQESPEGKR